MQILNKMQSLGMIDILVKLRSILRQHLTQNLKLVDRGLTIVKALTNVTIWKEYLGFNGLIVARYYLKTLSNLSI